jgi:hypothetical protein
MRKTIAIALAAGVGLLAAAAYADGPDNEAGVPLSPAEAAGAWTLESDGHSICTIKLGVDKAKDAYPAKAQSSCREALAGDPAGWRPTHDGMQLVGADGAPLLAFARWSNSLFVSHRSSGVDLQLRRGREPTP